MGNSLYPMEEMCEFMKVHRHVNFLLVQIFTCSQLLMDSLPHTATKAAITQVLVTQRIMCHPQEIILALITAVPVHVLLI